MGSGPEDGKGTDLEIEAELDPVELGVAKEVAVPSTPASVASPSVAATEADETLRHVVSESLVMAEMRRLTLPDTSARPLLLYCIPGR